MDGEIYPFVSIVIPTFNRPDRLSSCLIALDRSNYPRDFFEVIVVDDGSSEPLDKVVEPFRNRFSLCLIRQPNRGPAAARNAGAARARGELLAFTDDDCEPSPNWLKALTNWFSENPDYALGGRTIPIDQNSYSIASQTLLDYLYSYYNEDSLKGARFLTSNNLAVPSSSFQAVGGFDPHFRSAGGEDRELCDRWVGFGFRMEYLPEAVVYHNQAATFGSFVRQHLRYGRGAYHFHRIRSLRNGGKWRIEPFSFYRNLLGHPFRQSKGRKAFRTATLLGVTQLANAFGFFIEWVFHTVHSPKGKEIVVSLKK